jgi:hypothetical protein
MPRQTIFALHPPNASERGVMYLEDSPGRHEDWFLELSDLGVGGCLRSFCDTGGGFSCQHPMTRTPNQEPGCSSLRSRSVGENNNATRALQPRSRFESWSRRRGTTEVPIMGGVTAGFDGRISAAMSTWNGQEGKQ